ncbi:MAG: hypothetical protein ACLFU5_03290 [Thermoplasmata archaeon]
MDEDTRMGIDFMRYGLYVSVAMNFLFGIIVLMWSYDPSGDPSEMACFITIFALASGILYLIAIYKLYEGAERNTVKHERKVNRAVVLIIIGFFFGMVSPSIDGASLIALRNSMLLRSSTKLIQQISYALAMVLLIYELAGKKARKYLYGGASILILGSIFNLGWSFFFIPQDGEILDVLLVTLRMLSGLMLLLAVGYFIISVGYTKTAKSPKRTGGSVSKKISVKKECPNCGSQEFTKYLDGSGYCESCEKTIKGTDKLDKKELEEEKPG